MQVFLKRLQEQVNKKRSKLTLDSNKNADSHNMFIKPKCIVLSVKITCIFNKYLLDKQNALSIPSFCYCAMILLYSCLSFSLCALSICHFEFLCYIFVCFYSDKDYYTMMTVVPLFWLFTYYVCLFLVTHRYQYKGISCGCHARERFR